MKVEVAGARVGEGRAVELLERAAEVAEEEGVTIQLMDARLVCGREHAEVAVEKAVRAQESGRMTSRSLGTEILLYASGETQITQAIEKMGVRDETREVAVVLVGDVDLTGLVSALGLTRDDVVLEATDEKLAAFGLSAEELASADERQAAELILERVARVDLLK